MRNTKTPSLFLPYGPDSAHAVNVVEAALGVDFIEEAERSFSSVNDVAEKLSLKNIGNYQGEDFVVDVNLTSLKQLLKVLTGSSVKLVKTVIFLENEECPTSESEETLISEIANHANLNWHRYRCKTNMFKSILELYINYTYRDSAVGVDYNDIVRAVTKGKQCFATKIIVKSPKEIPSEVKIFIEKFNTVELEEISGAMLSIRANDFLLEDFDSAMNYLRLPMSAGANKVCHVSSTDNLQNNEALIILVK